MVLFFNTKPGWVNHSPSVIGENQQSFTQEIEAPSIKKVLKLLWQIVVEGSSAVSVLREQRLEACDKSHTVVLLCQRVFHPQKHDRRQEQWSRLFGRYDHFGSKHARL